MSTFFIVLSWIATAFGFFKFLPQTVRVLRKQSVEGLSPQTFIIYLMGASLWIMYTAFVGVGSGKSFIAGTFAPFMANLLNDILIIPILWLMFKNKLIPLLFAGFAVTTITLGFTFYGLNINVGEIAKLIIVIAAGTFTGFGFFPQVVKTFREKQAKEFSLSATWLGACTDLLWTIWWCYTVFQRLDNSVIVISTYILSTAFTGILTILLFILIVIVPYYNKKAGLIDGPVYSLKRFKKEFKEQNGTETTKVSPKKAKK